MSPPAGAPLRVLQVIHDFLPRHTAGSELYCYHLSRELARRHHVTLLFAERDAGRPRYEVRRSSYDGLPFYEVAGGRERRFEETYLDPAMDRILERVLDETRPDVVHLHHLLHHSIGYLGAVRRRGIPLVFTLHDYWLTCPNGGQRMQPDGTLCPEIDPLSCAGCIHGFEGAAGLATRLAAGMAEARRRRAAVGSAAGPEAGRGRAVLRAVHRRLPSSPPGRRAAKVRERLDRVRRACDHVDLFLAPSRFLRDEMVRFGLPAERIVVSDISLPGDAFDGFQRTRSETLRFGFVGTVAPHKGLHVLLEALSRLRGAQASGRAMVRVHGPEGWFPDYAARCRRLASGLPVEFRGPFRPAEAASVYSGIDVLVVPSIWWENSPITIHEAMATGTPVIASDHGGMRELVRDGENGLWFRAGDAADLAARMAWLLADRRRLERLGRPIPVRSIADDAREMEQRYARLLARRALQEVGA